MGDYDPKLIYDVGLNVGQDAEFYLKKGFRVVGIEANPAVAEVARARLSKISNNFQIVVAGIGPEQGTRTFYVNRAHHEQSTFVKALAGGPMWELGAEEIAVPVTTIDTLIARHGVPYYMKVDIEAWDMVLLEQLSAISARPKYLSVESGPGTDWIRKLSELGYTYQKLVNQCENSKLMPPNPAREGRFAEHSFELGSSGLFGDEIPTPWQRSSEVEAEWQRHIDSGFPVGKWFDVHGRLSP